MSSLPESTILGKLQIIEIYVYYDQPCLFSCQNQSGQIYIVIWVDTTEAGDTWLYAPVSLNRFKDITTGKIDIREIFSHSEDAFIFEVITHYEENLSPIVKAILCEQIEENYLPEAGEKIQSEGDSSIKNIGREVALERSFNEAIQISWEKLQDIFFVFIFSAYFIYSYISGSLNLFKNSYEDLRISNTILIGIIILMYLNRFLEKRFDTSFSTNTFTIEGSMNDVTDYNFLAIAISFKQLVENHPEAEQKIVRIEKLKNNLFAIQVKTAKNIDENAFKEEFFKYYWSAKSLPLEYLRQLVNGDVFASNFVIMLRTFLTDFTNLTHS